MTALGEQELREIAEHAGACFGNGLRWLHTDHPDFVDLAVVPRVYAEGVIAERLRQRAGEGRDGLAGSQDLNLGERRVAVRESSHPRRLSGSSEALSDFARSLAETLDLACFALAGYNPRDPNLPRWRSRLHVAWLAGLVDDDDLRPPPGFTIAEDVAEAYLPLIVESRAREAGLLDEPAAQPAGSADPPDCAAPALKVEHPALSGPRYWPLPDGREERYELLHGTIVPWLRGQIGESREMATFTVVNDEPAAQPVTHRVTLPCGCESLERGGHFGVVWCASHRLSAEVLSADATVRERFERIAEGQGPAAHPAPDPLRSPGDDQCPECQAWPCICGTDELAVERARRLDDADDELHRATGEGRN